MISAVTAIPHDERALRVQWRNMDISSLTGYVVEWRPLLKADFSLTKFEIVDRNQSSLIITGMSYKAAAGLALLILFNFNVGFPTQVLLLFFREFKQSLSCKTFFFSCTTRLHTLVGAYGH